MTQLRNHMKATNKQIKTSRTDLNSVSKIGFISSNLLIFHSPTISLMHSIAESLYATFSFLHSLSAASKIYDE